MFRALKIVLIVVLVCCGKPVWADPQYFMVGDLDDPRCQFATIAQALQAAANNGPELDYVMVANNAAHTGQALRVFNQSVLIEGGLRELRSRRR